MQKKRLILAVLLALPLSIAGCGNSEERATAAETANIIPPAGETAETGETAATAPYAAAPDITVPGVPGTIIPDQTFEADLDGWGSVTFASLAPETASPASDGMYPDVRFCLVKDGNVLYEFPGWNEEYTSPDQFLAVSAVAFRDYNEDGLQDVITLCEYESTPDSDYRMARVFFQLQDRQGFEEDRSLTEYLLKNHLTDSIASILGAKEDYRDYSASLNGQSETQEQLKIIAENKDMWIGNPEYADDLYQYAVTDLDRNGRYEVIVSNMGGTGMYTYNRFFEVNENCDGLTECSTDFVEGDSQPDLMTGSMGGPDALPNTMSTLDTYVNDQGMFCYAVYDMVKNGAAEYYENIRSLTLQDGMIRTAPIASRTTIYDGETPTVTCSDADGNPISEEEYESAADRYFAGWEKRETRLGWQSVKDLGNTVDEITAQLEQSLNVYQDKNPFDPTPLSVLMWIE